MAPDTGSTSATLTLPVLAMAWQAQSLWRLRQLSPTHENNDDHTFTLHKISLVDTKQLRAQKSDVMCCSQGQTALFALISLNSPVIKWYLKGGVDVTDGAVISFLL